MKNISLYILLTALTVNYAIGQNTTERWEPDTITFYNANEDYTDRQINTYNNKGNREHYLEQVWRNNQWENSYRATYTYDANGNTLTIFNQSWSGSQWGDTNKTIYTYNSQNKVLTWLSWYSYSKSFYVYKYDDKGNNIELLFQSWDGNQWENSYLTTYNYDANSNKIYELRMPWKNNQWDSTYQYFYTYDANNQKTEEVRQQFRNNQWENTTRNTYTYNTNGYELEWTRFGWKGSIWEADNMRIKTYDGNNNLLTDIDSLFLSITYSSKTTYTYDGNNNRLSKLYEGLTSGGKWYSKTLNVYRYDAQNNLLSDSALNNVEGTWYSDAVFRWEYDENSNSVLGFNQKWDFGLADWKNDNSANNMVAYYNNMQSSYNVGRIYKFSVSYKKTKINTTQISESICQGNIYNFHGKILTQADIYYDTLLSHGIDSVVELTLIVNPLPDKPTISKNGNVLTSSLADSYQWYFNGTAITGATEQNYTCTQNGNYSVEVTNEYGCTAKSDNKNVTDVGITNYELRNTNYVVYPNPTTGQLRITNYELRGYMGYSIYSVVGQKVLQGKLQDETTVINVEALAKGLYYLRVGEKTVKFVKE